MTTPRWLRLVRRIWYCRRGHQWIWRRDDTAPTVWYLECVGCLSRSDERVISEVPTWHTPRLR